MKEKYLYHVTVTTGHANKSPRSEVSADTSALLAPWIDDMFNGVLRAVFDTDYACKCIHHNAKYAAFEIVRLDDALNHTPLIRFSVCRHSSRKEPAWAMVDGAGEPPNVPFCAVKIYQNNVTITDMLNMPLFADLERCIAWAYIDRRGVK
ncbi:lactate dehydrogenase [Aggregatibacter actinomycetemcomitans serotype b str. SCC4092]|uniref:Lactate dehydrogenase A2-like protein n=1 Tax=Aggregatibacter actinomycetemcomitans TaxID=714 RepID=Q8RQ57_AGGAC|nr:hypothetical protein [Aggregatibacter actinomycetemcomitans]AAL91679.1 lactate dehydrogenase A2-like protein [Aggregatibacter actinomycetemcomitans]KND83413.1 lactate dehydrogenase [Aggregatibacter actinomycetemcomitans serotype b str. SCC1398]KOE54147.1 lactate dehydrogenase [Aggregatibacter actinomycetemcomitans serotype b str. SCC4092]KYK74091.1 lactate dehydrogenase [Aggregatibacter actinomycetemcomitans serotype e str. SA3096]KYK95148.1 lactate dehydrogenase [Aggregatibacter actinomyce